MTGSDIVGIFTLAIVFTILADVIRHGTQVSTLINGGVNSFSGIAKLAGG